MMTDTQELLANYLKSGSESAFRELVTGYLDLVYSTAVRLVDGDTHRAKDVSQIVFADLARMAGKLSASTTLGGWLHRHTCYVARGLVLIAIISAFGPSTSLATRPVRAAPQQREDRDRYQRLE